MDRPTLTQGDGGRPKPDYRDLFLRVNSALVLIAAALLLSYAGAASFALLIGLFVAVMAWEWRRLVGGARPDAGLAVHLVATVFAAVLTLGGYPAHGVLMVLLGAAAVFCLDRATLAPAQAWWAAGGVGYIGLPTVALIWLRGDVAFGWHAVLFLFTVVWTTDSAAYLFGRLIGGPKLAPRISPNKTWSGLLGGAAAAALACAVFAMVLGGSSVMALALLGLALALVSQLGDLGESAVKRLFGMKDTSGVIPGHGGVLDRVDGLIFAALAGAVIALAIDPHHPGRALLIWP